MLIVSAFKAYPKSEELILCLAAKASNIGITKLEKLMYLCDFEAIRTLGKSITEDTYTHFELGPVPKHFIPAHSNLLRNGRLTERKITLSSGFPFTELTPQSGCDEKIFSPEEMEVINSVLKEYGAKSSRELVKLTHDELGYKITRPNEVIPDFLAYYREYQRPSQKQVDALLSDSDYVASIKKQISESRVTR